MVLLGAKPNVLVFKKLLGSYEVSSLVNPVAKEEPTLSGFGINSSSGLTNEGDTVSSV